MRGPERGPRRRSLAARPGSADRRRSRRSGRSPRSPARFGSADHRRGDRRRRCRAPRCPAGCTRQQRRSRRAPSRPIEDALARSSWGSQAELDHDQRRRSCHRRAAITRPSPWSGRGCGVPISREIRIRTSETDRRSTITLARRAVSPSVDRSVNQRRAQQHDPVRAVRFIGRAGRSACHGSTHGWSRRFVMGADDRARRRAPPPTGGDLDLSARADAAAPPRAVAPGHGTGDLESAGCASSFGERRGGRGDRPRGPPRRDLRLPRPERRRARRRRRDPRGLPASATRGEVAVLGVDPAQAPSRLARAGRDRAAGVAAASRA